MEVTEVGEIVNDTIRQIADKGGNIIDVMQAATQIIVCGTTAFCETKESALRHYDKWLVALLTCDDAWRRIIEETYDEVEKGAN